MKKILSLILCLSFLLSSFSISTAFAAVNYEKPANFDEMTGLLSALDITDKDYAPTNAEITRGEFTKLVVKASGLGEFVSEKVEYRSFSDVLVDNEYAPYIELAKSKRLAYGYSDGTFKPEESITLTEAIVYLIRLLGYVDVAEERGGYPGGYQTLAYSIDLMPGIRTSLSSFVTEECAVNLIFNALNADVLMVSEFSKESYEIVAGHPLMYQSFKVVKEEGIVEGVDLTSLVGPNDVKPWHIKVDGILIDVGNLNPNNLLGYNVNAYYKADENGTNVLKFISKNSVNEEVIIDIADITNIANYTVYKTENQGKQKLYSYLRGAAIIFNGASTGAAFNMSIFNDEDGNKLNGTVKLLDNNGDTNYDVIFVEAYEEFIAGKIDTATKTVYDYNSVRKNIVLDNTVNDPFTIIYDEEGEEIGINKIKTKSSIVVYRSKGDAPQKFIRAYVSEKTVSGVFTSMGYDDSDRPVIQIGSKEYRISPYGYNHKDEKLLGSVVTALINHLGEVCLFYTGDNDGFEWGLLKAVGEPKNYGQTYVFRILTDLGEFVDFAPAKYVAFDGGERVKSDDTSIMGMGALLSTIRKAEAVRINKERGVRGETPMELINLDSQINLKDLNQMVKYRVNSDNQITYFDTLLDKEKNPATRLSMESDDSVYCEFFTNKTTYTLGGIHIGTKYYATAATKVFLYHPDNIEDYGVVAATNVYQSYIRAAGYAFYSSENSIYPDVFMRENDKKSSYGNMYTNHYAIVKKMTDVIDDEGLPAKKIYVSVNNESVVFVASPDLKPNKVPAPSGTSTYNYNNYSAKDLQTGDIIIYSCDTITGELANYDLIYNRDGIFNPADTGNTHEMGYVYEVQNDGIIYVVSDSIATLEDEIANDASDKVVAARMAAGSVTIYDSASVALGEKIKAGSLSDFFAYKDFKDTRSEEEKLQDPSNLEHNVSKILVHYYNSGYKRPIDIFILK